MKEILSVLVFSVAGGFLGGLLVLWATNYQNSVVEKGNLVVNGKVSVGTLMISRELSIEQGIIRIKPILCQDLPEASTPVRFAATLNYENQLSFCVDTGRSWTNLRTMRTCCK